MIARFGQVCARLAERFMPNPFVFALLLSAVVLAGGWWHWPAPPGDAFTLVLQAWFDGFWSKPLLAFGFQMALILVTGYTVADAPPTRRLLARVAGAWSTPAGAAALCALVAVALSWIHWGLGLVGGALLAREIGRVAARRGRPLPYPLVVAGAYAGFIVWHGGLSGSAPLVVAQPDHALADLVGAIGLRSTVLSLPNLLLTLAMAVVIPLVIAAMARRAPAGGRVPDHEQNPAAPDERQTTPGARLGQSRLVTLTALAPAAAALALVVVPGVASGERPVDLNVVLFVFLFAGLALHGSPMAIVGSFRRGAGEAAPILLQFPFYFAVMGVMRDSGLVTTLARAGVDASLWLAESGLPAGWCFQMLTFLTAGLVNLFVPSGGGQWAVQGEIVLQAALDPRIGLPPGRAVMALAYGDAWTNMLQPFWALALLSITGTSAREIMGYTIAVMLLVSPLYLIVFAL
ncbi:MAG: TIGR00366 family protein [Acidobacteriota bacterium]|nr:TIGR00366 family protein [Acidobacteriota bacterium]